MKLGSSLSKGFAPQFHFVTMHPEQKRIFQSMTPEQKLNVALRLYYSAMELKETSLRVKYPDWSEEMIRDNIRKIFLYART
jgi:hypothetical protein